MAKRNRITPTISKTIADSSPFVKKTKLIHSKIEDESIVNIPLNNLKNNPYQPRIDIDLQSLNELISSIEKNGLLQPIIVTEADKNNKHTIIAGHRRYEAYKILGKEKIKAIIIKDIKDKDLAILSLTENLMRENLHPIENAIAIKNILDSGIVESQNKLAEYVGLSKGHISKLMNILKLPSSIIKMVKKDNYKDINILVLLNKLENEELMSKAYLEVKDLPRNEAEKYIKNRYFKKSRAGNSLINIKKTANKINITIDIKKLDKEKISIIDKKIAALNSEIESFIRS